MKNYIKFVLILSSVIFSLSVRAEVTSGICKVKSLPEIKRVTRDILAQTIATFDCESLNGLNLLKNQVFANVSENDYLEIKKIFNSQSLVNFEFDGTYGGKLFSYNGLSANWTPLPNFKTGLKTKDQYTILTFKDVKGAVTLNMKKLVDEIGTIKIKSNLNSISAGLNLDSDGLGELELVVLTKDIKVLLGVTSNIFMTDGLPLSADSVAISGESAYTLAGLMIDNNFLVNRGSSHRAGSSYSSFWDYVKFGKTEKNTIFHCANFHSGQEFTKCFINLLRIK